MPKLSPHRLKGKIIRIDADWLSIRPTLAPSISHASWTRETNATKSARPKRPIASKRARSLTNTLIRSQVAMLLRTRVQLQDLCQPLHSEGQQLAESGERNKNYIRTTRLFLDNDNWGLVRHFGTRDVRDLTTRDWQLFIEKLSRKRSDLSSSTRNMLMATFRNVLKVARDDGLIDVVPATPRQRQKDNPRSFFRFAPLVEPERDEYQQLLQGAKRLADDHAVVRGVEVTGELYDLILFWCILSCVRHRPNSTRLKHNDITVEKDPKRLLVTVRNGKTGYRVANTMSGAVSAYERIKARYPDAGGEDYLFLPEYPNRRRLHGSSSVSSISCWMKQDSNTIRRRRRSAASIACATPRSACGSFSHTARSTSSTSPRMPAPASSRSNASMPSICRSHVRWRRICRVLARGSRRQFHR